MEKVSFTPAGLQALLQQLYALPNTDLEQEALAIAQDFRSWVKAHFTLDQDQEAYLDGVDQQFINQAGQRSSYYVGNRLPVNLIKMARPTTTATVAGEEDRGKLLDLDEKNSNVYSPESGYGESSSLTFTISYLE